jgi:hypothetical protein
MRTGSICAWSAFDGLKIGGNEFHFDVLVDDLVEETGVECFVEVNGAGLKGLALATREGEEFASEREAARSACSRI